MWQRSIRMLFVMAVGVLAMLTVDLPAAEKYEVDEQVEVYHHSSWTTATVRETNKKGEVLAEFTFAGGPMQKVFAPENVRHMYESGAIARGRFWSDTTGNFKIKAALLKISGGKVELRTDEMKEVVVSIDKLSSKDQTFIKQFQKNMGIAALPVPALPTITEFDTQNANTKVGPKRDRDADKLDPATIRVSLEADPIRKGLDLTQAGCGFPSAGYSERLSSLIALGGADNWILASIGENEKSPTRLMWVALAKSTVKKIQMLPPGENLMDYHAASRQMLTFSKRKIDTMDADQHPVLTIWQVDPSTEEPKAVLSWNARLAGERSWMHALPWVRFASANNIIQRTESHRILSWDVSSKRLAWTTPQESFFAPEPLLSAGGKYVYLPEDSGVRIMDAANGEMIGHVPMDGCSGIAVHPNGRLIAAVNQREGLVVDITGAETTQKFSVASVSSPFRVKLDWISDKYLCFDNSGFVLYSIEHELPVWTYTFDSNAYWAMSGGGRQRSIVDDHLVYAATFSLSGKTGLAVGAVELPGPKAQAAIASVKRDDFYAIRPGTSFRVSVTALDHASEIRQALENIAIRNGWTLDENATNVIEAEYKRGETREVQYELRSIRSGDRQIQSASITPYITNVVIKYGGEPAWQMFGSSGPPPMVSLKEGESLQSEVDRWTQPNWRFFETLSIPPNIIDPKKRGGLGKTSVTNRGLLEQTIE